MAATICMHVRKLELKKTNKNDCVASWNNLQTPHSNHQSNYHQPDKVLSLSLSSKWRTYRMHAVGRSLSQSVDLFWPNWSTHHLMNLISQPPNLPPLQRRRGYGFSKQLQGCRCVRPASPPPPCCRCCKRSNGIFWWIKCYYRGFSKLVRRTK